MNDQNRRSSLLKSHDFSYNVSMLIAFLTGDLVFPSRIRPVAERLGAQFQTALGEENLLAKLIEANDDSIVILDLSSNSADPTAILPRLKALPKPPRVIAFAPHVHAAKLDAARSAGCEIVLTRGQFDSTIDSLLAQLVANQL